MVRSIVFACTQLSTVKLSTKFKSSKKHAGSDNFAAIQVAVYVLQFLQKVPWLAKDIVWLVVEADSCVLQSTKVCCCFIVSYRGFQLDTTVICSSIGERAKLAD